MIVSGASVCNNTACSLCFLGPCVRTPCAFLWHIAFLDDCCSNRKALSTALHEVEGSFSLLPLWQYWNRLSQQKPQKKQKAVLTACSTLRASPHPLSKAEVYAVAFCITFFVLFCCCCLFWTLTLEWPVSWPSLLFQREAAEEGLRGQQNRAKTNATGNWTMPGNQISPEGSPHTYFRDPEKASENPLLSLCTQSLGPSSLRLPNSPSQKFPGPRPKGTSTL